MPDGIEIYIRAPSTKSLDFIVDSSSERRFPRNIERGGCIGWMERLLSWILCFLPILIVFRVAVDWSWIDKPRNPAYVEPLQTLPYSTDSGSSDEAPRTENFVTISYVQSDGFSAMVFLVAAGLMIFHGVAMCLDDSHPADVRLRCKRGPDDEPPLL